MCEQLRLRIKEIKDDTGQYGQLMASATVRYTEVFDIIKLLEEDLAQAEDKASQELHNTEIQHQKKVAELTGRIGGYAKKVKALERHIDGINRATADG